MKLLLIALGVSLSALGGPNIDALNERAALTVAAGSSAEREARALLQRKIVDEWGVPAARLDEVARPLSQANYQIKLEPECSHYAERWIGRSDAYRAKLDEQVESAARFFADYHARVLGNNHSLFKIQQILICTDSVELDTPYLQYDRFRSELRLKIGPRLRIASLFPHLQNNLHPLTSDEIRTKWNEGEHWATDGFYIVEVLNRRNNPIRVYWPYINPVGEIRTGLREFIRREGVVKGTSLAGRLAQDGEQLLSQAREILDTERREKLDQALASATSASDFANQVLGSWSERLLSPNGTEEMAIASLGALGETARDQTATEVERTQIGLVNIENFHQIDVQFTAGDVREYQRVVVVPQSLKIQVRQVGLVNVSTGDQVRVRAFLSLLLAPGTFERATLSRVVDLLRR